MEQPQQQHQDIDNIQSLKQRNVFLVLLFGKGFCPVLNDKNASSRSSKVAFFVPPVVEEPDTDAAPTGDVGSNGTEESMPTVDHPDDTMPHSDAEETNSAAPVTPHETKEAEVESSVVVAKKNRWNVDDTFAVTVAFIWIVLIWYFLLKSGK